MNKLYRHIRTHPGDNILRIANRTGATLVDIAYMQKKIHNENILNLINWSEFSRQLTGNREQIRANYRGKKYRDRVNILIDVTTKYYNANLHKIQL